MSTDINILKNEEHEKKSLFPEFDYKVAKEVNKFHKSFPGYEKNTTCQLEKHF